MNSEGFATPRVTQSNVPTSAKTPEQARLRSERSFLRRKVAKEGAKRDKKAAKR